MSTTTAHDNASPEHETIRIGIITDDHLYTPKKGFVGSIVRFDDGSLWELTHMLSSTKHQQAQSPYEATRVFGCVCLKDPRGNFGGIREAVIKMKYQIKGTEDDALELSNIVKDLEAKRAQNPDLDQDSSELESAQEELYLATHPTPEPSNSILREIKALRHFRKKHCKHAPHLLDFCDDMVRFGVDEMEMTGGFVAFILMTKVPGERLTYEMFFRLSLEKRADIRAAFREALIDIRRKRVEHRDEGRRNIIWDEQRRKCYIVDFEDYAIQRYTDADNIFDDYEYDIWGLAESCFRGW